MISANELRIGNWVTYHGEEDMPCWVDAQDILNIDSKYMGNDELHSPLPITPERLEKAGFEIVYQSDPFTKFRHIQDPSFGFLIVEDQATKIYEARFKECELKCHYVHQLQNIYFVLSGGKELIINL